MRKIMLWGAVTGLALAGCGERTPNLPEDVVAKAATCGVVAAATERAKAGVKGDLPVEAQERIFHYALLAGSEDGTFNAERANAVSSAMPGLFDKTIKGKWQTLQPACAQAFPPTTLSTPILPSNKFDSLLQCYVLIDFTRKALAGAGAAYSEPAVRLGGYAARLDGQLSPLLAKAGVKAGDPLQARRNEALAKAANLGQPPEVLKACEAKYPSGQPS